jgi:hypothetical protein
MKNGRRRLPPPWKREEIAGGFVVRDANGQALGYFYGHVTRQDADIAKGLTLNEARRLASNFAKLPALLGIRTPKR